MTWGLVRNAESGVHPDLNQNVCFKKDLHDLCACSSLRSPSLDDSFHAASSSSSLTKPRDI